MTDTELYPHTCTITPQTAADDTGEEALTAGTPVTGVACHWQSRGAREMGGRAVRVLERDKVFLPWGTAITRHSLISNVQASDDSVIAAGPLEVAVLAPYPDSHYEAEVEQVG